MSWNRTTQAEGANSKPAQTSKGGVRVLLVGLAVVALGGIAAWCLLSDSGSHKATRTAQQKNGLIKEVKPAAAPTNRVEVVQPKPKDPHEGMRQASNGVWHPTNRPYRAGSKYTHAVRTNMASRIRAKNSLHKNAVEQVLLQIFTCEVGDMPWALPAALPEEEMKRLTEILISKNEIKDTDSETAVYGKEVLAAAKKEMMQFIKDGGEPEDFIVHYHDELEKAFYAREDAREYVKEMLDNKEDPKIIEALIEKTNEKFAAKGIKPIEVPAELNNLLED